MNHRELTQVNDMIRQWRDYYPAVKTADELQPIATLTDLAGEEILEAKDEHLKIETPEYQPLEHHKEIADVLVFLFSFCIAHEVYPDLVGAEYKANGQGKKSSIYDSLYAKAMSLTEGNTEKNVNDFLVHLISLSHYLPNTVNIVATMKKVLDKNTANREPSYYSDLDQKGKKLSKDQQLRRRQHNEKMLRVLRNTYGSPLEPWMHQPFAKLILDYTDSSANLGVLNEKIKAQDIQLAEAVLDYNQGVLLTPRQLTHGLLKAGGIDLSSHRGVIYQAV